MPTALSDCLDQISEHSAAVRAAVASAGDTELRVPDCPDWNLRDLVVHVGEVQRSWAGQVRRADAEVPPVDDLLERSATSPEVLIDALREAGPDAPCWTWWEDSDAPSNAGAVARHQVQEAALQAWDAKSAIVVLGLSDPYPAGDAQWVTDELIATVGSSVEC